MARAVENRGKIRGNNLRPGILAHLAKRPVARDAGVVYQHVDGAVVGRDLFHHRTHFVVVSHIGFVEVYGIAFALHLLLPCTGFFFRTVVGAHKVAVVVETLADVGA